MKNTPSTGCSSRPRRRRRRRRTGNQHVARHAGFVQQARDLQPGERGVLGWLVEHRVAHQQRRHDDVAADEPRVVPGGDVRHHAERHVLDLLAHAAFVEHRLARDRLVHFLQEEVDAGRRPFSSLRDILIGLPVSSVIARASDSRSRTTAARKFRMHSQRWASGMPAQSGWAARAAAALTDLCRVVGGQLSRSAPVAGLWISSWFIRGHVPHARRRESPRSNGVSSTCRRAAMELGMPLHGGHAGRRRCGGWPR